MRERERDFDDKTEFEMESMDVASYVSKYLVLIAPCLKEVFKAFLSCLTLHTQSRAGTSRARGLSYNLIYYSIFP